MATDGVLVLTGPPCSGKSSAGRLLAGGTYVQVDAVFELLLPGSDRNKDDRKLGYDAAHVLARLLAGRGRFPVLECTYARREQRAGLVSAMADLPDVPLWVVEFFVTPDDAVSRFRARDQATDLDDRLVRERAATFPYTDGPLRLASASSTPAELAGQVTAWVRRRPAPMPRDRWVEAGIGWD